MEKARDRQASKPREAPELSEAIRVEGSPTRCPTCPESCDQEGARVCAGCLARHHGACWDELGRCGRCQGERALIAGPVTAKPPGTCRACGTDASASITCLGCQRDVCRACYRQRFRRCEDCALPMLRADFLLSELRRQRMNGRFGLFLLVLFTLGFAVGVTAAIMDKGASREIVLPPLIIAPGFVFLFIICLKRLRVLNEAIAPLEEELAPFDQGLVAGIFEDARRMITEVTRKFRS